MLRDNMTETTCTARATANIAFIKYWGKRGDGSINLPLNPSISMTLDEGLAATTTVHLAEQNGEDELWLNGKREEMRGGAASEKSRYIQRTLDHMRALARDQRHAVVVSENSFPTGSGLASSAAGGAALVVALDSALKLGLSGEAMSVIARTISGSACRSLFGGIVKWQAGAREDGTDSYSVQVAAPGHWPELMDIIAVVDASKKKVSSSEGHMATAKTGVLMRERIGFAEEGTARAVDAVMRRDFGALAETIMRDSNSLHAVMLDTWPPIIYLNDASKEIIEAVHEMNGHEGRNIAAYTFDAGPNAHIITTEADRQRVLDMLRGIKGVRSIIESRQGGGPRVIEDPAARLGKPA